MASHAIGYVFDERYLWHRTWSIQYTALTEPFKHWESPETKRRFHSLLVVSGLLDQLQVLRARTATEAELRLIHTERYVSEIKKKSAREEGGNGGEETPFSQFAFEIASLSTGGVLTAVDAVMNGQVRAAYALTRPPGHHATPDRGMGFCLFNNVAIAARFLQKQYPDQVKRVAIVDYDVHHGNGTQDAFFEDDSVLLISIHQANNYPADSGRWEEIGALRGEGYTVNVPLPPGSGHGAYEYTFHQIVTPAVQRFKPDFILVSSGFDASYADPLAAMILSSNSFRFMANELIKLADTLCQGRIIFAHEGGYSETYAPFCGTAVVEALLGVNDPSKRVFDPFLEEAERWEYHDLQDHQRRVVDQVAVLHNLDSTDDLSQ
ncbi:hypothetical protein Poli38472_007716 [Pythium oligandrum]|uniref:Histone deacetylase domain-containing protein n=1 Tax=Pythium oligandrum TaxID=41045 RepID=A0A8K1CRQ9_PYTOL|nr:hypothetical protein Poli38472_007716 [Pythium oligandrum]|eukprot:TMW68044.1 hypothetical protein Poli38472_007716 [Pythium oligandrum]